MAAAQSELHVKIKPDVSEVTGLTDLLANVQQKVDAGAALAYALYHIRREDVEWFTSAPKPVLLAYARACDAYAVDTRSALIPERTDQ